VEESTLTFEQGVVFGMLFEAWSRIVVKEAVSRDPGILTAALDTVYNASESATKGIYQALAPLIIERFRQQDIPLFPGGVPDWAFDVVDRLLFEMPELAILATQ